jgi:AcrR family transcriptional regulator
MPTTVPSDERRKQLLVLAAEIVARDGTAALTMERLAEWAEVTKPIVYRHFANRTSLVTAVVESAWARLDEAVATALIGVPEGPDRIRTAFSAAIAHMAQEGPGVRTLLDNAGGDPVVERIRHERAVAQASEWANQFAADFGLSESTATAAAAVLQGALAGAVEHASRSTDSVEDAQEVFVTTMTATLSTLATQSRRSRRRAR